MKTEMKRKGILKRAAFLMVFLFLITLAGCGSSAHPSKNRQGNPAVSGQPAAVPKIVNIGTQQIPNDEAVAAAKGYFEEELDTKVNIQEFQAGDIRNAMVAGNIDFAMLGSSSAALGIASGMDVELIWIHEILGESEGLAVQNGSQIHSVKDLKGKRIATPFATTAHYSLLKALEQNHISEKEVTLYDMQMPDLYAAWQRNDIDAAYAWEPTLSNLLENGRIILSSKQMADKGVATANVELVRKDFAEKYPDMVTRYLRALDRAVALYQQNPDDAISAVVKSMNVPEADARRQMQGSLWLTAKQQADSPYLGSTSQKGEIVDSLMNMADFLYQNKNLVDQPKRSTFEQVVNPAYAEKALR